MKKIIVIGAGFSGLSAACYLAREGYSVEIFEKNGTVGGRAGRLSREGFTFDTGPTFYWMPDVFERFFADFGKSPKDYYLLERLNPGYEIRFGPEDRIRVSADPEVTMRTFESMEPGSGKYLKRFLREAEINYRVAMNKAVYKPGKSPLELVSADTALRSAQFMYSLGHTVKRNIRDRRLRQVLEFPVLFLGAAADSMPSFYRFMNYADMVLGTWHVKGGMYNVAEGIRSLASSLGVKINTGTPVKSIRVRADKASGVETEQGFHAADAVVSGADYRHTETMLSEKSRNYPDEYWDERVFAPSALLYYMGFDGKIDDISQHTLFFDTDFDRHIHSVYRSPRWPEKPLFYGNFPTVTDRSMGPEEKEGAVILIPVASGLRDTQRIREYYLEHIVRRMEAATGQRLAGRLRFWESYAGSDFAHDFNSCRGNAYGLANTLRQTAFLKPKAYNRRLGNLFYCGQLTVPGPGVPTALISGKIAAGLAHGYLNKRKTEYGYPV